MHNASTPLHRAREAVQVLPCPPLALLSRLVLLREDSLRRVELRARDHHH